MSFSDLKVICKNGNRSEHTFQEFMTHHARLSLGQFDSHPEFGNCDRRYCNVVIVLDDPVEPITSAL